MSSCRRAPPHLKPDIRDPKSETRNSELETRDAVFVQEISPMRAHPHPTCDASTVAKHLAAAPGSSGQELQLNASVDASHVGCGELNASI